MQRSEEIDGNWNRYRLEILDVRDKADISRYYIPNITQPSCPHTINFTVSNINEQTNVNNTNENRNYLSVPQLQYEENDQQQFGMCLLMLIYILL